MLDIKFLRTNPDIVKQNIKNKFQDEKLPLVDQVIELDKEFRESKTRAEALRANRNKVSKQIGALMGQGKKEEAEEIKKQVTDMAEELEALTAKETALEDAGHFRQLNMDPVAADDLRADSGTLLMLCYRHITAGHLHFTFLNPCISGYSCKKIDRTALVNGRYQICLADHLLVKQLITLHHDHVCVKDLTDRRGDSFPSALCF